MKKKYVIGQVTPTGIEYVKDVEDCVRHFGGVLDVKNHLRDLSKAELENIVIRESCGTCFRCGEPLFKSDVAGYTYQCFHCDEDFYSIEQKDATPDRSMDPYHRYQLEWMIAHGYSLHDLIQELTQLQYDDPEDSDRISTSVGDLFNEWVSDIGFGSEIWACRSEWENSPESDVYPSKSEEGSTRTQFTIIIGDQSGDGHKLSEVFYASARKSIDDVRNAYRRIIDLGIDLTSFCCDFDDDALPNGILQRLQDILGNEFELSSGWYSEDDDMYHIDTDQMVQIIIALLNHVDPDLDVRLDAFDGLPELLTTENVGYGLLSF